MPAGAVRHAVAVQQIILEAARLQHRLLGPVLLILSSYGHGLLARRWARRSGTSRRGPAAAAPAPGPRPAPSVSTGGASVRVLHAGWLAPAQLGLLREYAMGCLRALAPVLPRRAALCYSVGAGQRLLRHQWLPRVRWTRFAACALLNGSNNVAGFVVRNAGSGF